MPTPPSAGRPTASPPRRPASGPASDADLLAALRRGEEAAFVFLVERDHNVLVGVAYGFLRNRAVAEEVAQESWLAFLQGLDRFEGRASIRTFVCAIVANKARTRAQREARSIPMSALERRAPDGGAREQDSGSPVWTSPARVAAESPERRLLGRETIAVLQAAIAVLPERQRRVLVLRDLHGLSSEQACAALGLTENNQRVLLHRARVRVRAAVAGYVGETLAA
jgi:RNA polymerase sigma-70 factor (ECF subfamily)